MTQLFTPFSVRGVTFRNRLVVSPMCQYAAEDGFVAEWHVEHHSRLALGGIGGAIVEATGVVPEGRITPGCLGIWSDEHIEGLKRITAIYRRHRAPVGIQIGHAGRKASASLPWEGARPLATAAPEKAWQTVGPSALPHSDGWPEPHELTVEEIAGLVEAFAEATRRALAAGFDFVEIHGAHGYLIHSFLAPVSNRRTDGYGGDLAGRMRFALEIAEAVRAVLPADRPLFYRTSAVDHVEGGVQLADTIALAKALKECGVDVIDCSSGGIAGALIKPNTPEVAGHQIPYAAAIRAEAGIATMAVGGITEPAQAEAVVAEGKADLVAIARELLADSNFPYRAANTLGAADPEGILPLVYDFYLKRRKGIAWR
jgi:2,4-dienoyl-CoA reductase-like NADH-dependent reductase (Old Yellow Enzyme family)